MNLRKALLSTLTFLIAIQFIHAGPSPKGLPQFSTRVITPPSVTAMAEESFKEYYFKPPTGTKWNYAPGNCTFGVASFTYVPAGLGNANTWDDRAKAMGYEVSSNPGVGRVAVDNSGYYGHVGLVIDMRDGMVLTREMNVLGLGSIIERWKPASYWDSYIVF